jgi:hypothetical protein
MLTCITMSPALSDGMPNGSISVAPLSGKPKNASPDHLVNDRGLEVSFAVIRSGGLPVNGDLGRGG